MPPQIWAPVNVVVGFCETLYDVAVGAGVDSTVVGDLMAVLATVCEALTV